MTAAAVGPVQRPEAFVTRTLLHEEFPVPIEYEERKSPMQHAAAGVTIGPVQMTDLAVRLVHEYQRLQIAKGVTDTSRQRPRFVCQKAYSKLSGIRVQSVCRHDSGNRWPDNNPQMIPARTRLARGVLLL
jgi:hypothetical protein